MAKWRVPFIIKNRYGLDAPIGSMCWAERFWDINGDYVEMREVAPFFTLMRFVRFEKSAQTEPHAILGDAEGHEYPMMMRYFEELLGRFYIGGSSWVHTEWDFAKHGDRHSLRLAEGPKQ